MPKIDKLTNQQQLDLKTGQAIQSAARDLPDTWEIQLSIASGSIEVGLMDAGGDNVLFPMNIDGARGYDLDQQINAAIDHARGMAGLKPIDRSEPEPVKPAFKRKVGR